MKTRVAAAVFFLGLLTTMGAVGGMDNSTDSQLVQCLALAVVGLALMFVGTSGLQVSDYYDQQ